jgi:hypothetical protein
MPVEAPDPEAAAEDYTRLLQQIAGSRTGPWCSPTEKQHPAWKPIERE